MGFKASETLLGIETWINLHSSKVTSGFKASETLLGIETLSWQKHNSFTLKIQSLWNPFRDWNNQLS